MTAQQFLDSLTAFGISPEQREELDRDLTLLLDNARSEGYSEGQDDAYYDGECD